MHLCTDNQADLCRVSKQLRTKLGPITAVIGVVRRDKRRARSPIELRVELPRLSLTQSNTEAQLQHDRTPSGPPASLDAAWMRPDPSARLFGTECTTSCPACMTYVGLPNSVSLHRWGHGDTGTAVQPYAYANGRRKARRR